MKISFTDYSSWTFWRLLTLLTVLTAGSASAQISGTVFRDFNANGTYEAIPASGTYAYGEATVTSITVTAYNAANTAVASTTTNNAGAYTLTTANGIVNGTAYRVEFTGVATGDFSGPQGTNNGSSVQFVTAGPTATAVNFGINYPTDYCQANPPIATACYVFGNQVAGTNGAAPVFITFPFDAGSRAVLINEGVTPATGAYDQPTAHTIMTAANQVGTTFGIAYARGTRTFYAAAYFKKHAGFGPGGPGAIYRINGTTGEVSSPFIVPNATLNRHDVANYQIDNGDVAWDAVGKTSLGGMDLSDDEQTLYVMNLENRNLYALNATTGAVTANAPMTAVTGCPVGDVRPFAVEFRRGTLYVGIICTAESNSTVTGNLQGYVYTANPATLALSVSPVFQFSLTYPRGKAAGTGPANWRPWRPFYTNISTSANTAATSNRIVYPMPMLTNLDFDVNNDLIIGLRDRLGDITGHNTFDNPGNPALATQGRIAGDVLRAASTGVNSWTLESNGRVGGRGTSRQGTNQGPGGAEFYQGDSYPLSSSITPGGSTAYTINSVPGTTYNYTITAGSSTVGPGQITLANGIQGFGENHDETSLGTLLQLPGQGEVMALVYDPVPDNNDDGFYDGGVRRMSNVTGSWTQSYRIYKGEATSTQDFGKAAGLSEPVAQCDPAPIEIGNRVWNDVNNNGIQDANETSYAAVAGLTVQLLQGGTVISTTTVSATGTYLFSSASTTAIQPNTAYQIRLVLPDNTRAISTSAVGANRAVDSDANSAGLIFLTTEDYGENNHTYDIGVFACILPTGTISATAATCLNNAPTANGRVAVTGITNGVQASISQGTSYTGVGFGGAGNVAVTGGAVSFVGLTGGRTYTVRVFSGTATCSQDFTIAVPQTNCCALTFADVVAGPCSTTTNQFTTTGRVTLGGAVAGNLVVSNGAQTVTIPVTSATTSVTFALVDESDGTTQTISASLAGCGSITTSVVSPAACFTVCPSSCNLVSIIRYPTTALANAEFSYQTLGAEARFGDDNIGTTSAYELDFNRVSPAFATLATGQYNWTTGTPNSFTLTYDPALPGQNRAVFTLQAGAQRVSIQTNPQAPATGTPLPVQFNAIQLSLQANDLIIASAQVSSLALNGNLLGTNLSAASLLTSRDTDDIIIRSSQRGQAFTLTGTLTFNFLTAPSENGLSFNIRLGTVNDCAAPPSVTVNSATIACQATSTTLTANSNQTGLTYQWTGPGGFAASTQSVTVTAPGTYTVVATNPDTGCASTTTTATVTRAPTVTATVSASPSNTVCQGTPVVLTANASGGTGFTYAWSPPGTGSTQSVTVTPALTTVYTVTVTNSNLCSTTATATVTVSPAVTAVITASPGSTICQGASVTLTASGGTAYRWSTGATTAVISVTPTSTTPYTVTVNNAAGCTGIASATITVNPAVTATVASRTICNGTSATLTANASGGTTFTYNWSPAGTGSTQTVTVSPTTTTPYTVTVTNNFGCSTITSATVTVNPAVTAVITASPGSTICQGASVTLTASATGGSGFSYTWSTGASTSAITVSPTSTTPYTVTVVNSSGCTGIASATVTVNPSVTATLSSATICNGTSATLTATGGTSYTLSNGSVSIGTTGSFTVSPTATTSYTVSVVNANGCTGIASATVTVNPAVTATLSSATICNGTSAVLLATGGTSYTLNNGTISIGTTGSFTVLPTATTSYTVSVVNANGCTGTASATVTVNPAVTAVITASPGSTICQGASVTLTASGGTAYRWSTGATTAVISVTPTSTTPYTVTVNNAAGCTGIASATVTVNPAVTATVNSATLTCQAPAAILTVTSSQTGLIYQWNGPAGFTATTQSVTVATPGTYTVITTNAQTGCSSTTTATVSQVAGVTITLFTQSNCLNNGTDATATDDFFTVTIQATNATPGAAGRYEVVLGADANGLGGTVLNPGGTPYGTSVTVGGVGQPNARGFLANGSSIYSLTVRDTNNSNANSGCRSTRLTGQVSPCSSCLPALCQPARLQRL